MRNKYGCERCHGDELVAQTTKLSGGYTARLCNACGNAWVEYVLHHPDFAVYYVEKQRLEWLKAQLQGGRPVDISEWQEQSRVVLRAELVLFKTSGDWVGAGVESEECHHDDED